MDPLRCVYCRDMVTLREMLQAPGSAALHDHCYGAFAECGKEGRPGADA